MSSADTEQPERFFPWGTGNPTFYLVVVASAAGVGIVAAAMLGNVWIAVVAGLAAFLVGGLFGFIFGIPRYATSEAAGLLASDTSAPAAIKYRANTNLEQVSDWLTKIIVGLGLTQFSTILAKVNQWSAALGSALTGEPGGVGQVAGCSLLVLGALTGFVFFYLWARVYLARMFQKAEE